MPLRGGRSICSHLVSMGCVENGGLNIRQCGIWVLCTVHRSRVMLYNPCKVSDV